jgi:predicted  nucleic acid-binding Zn-ribbon protein
MKVVAVLLFLSLSVCVQAQRPEASKATSSACIDRPELQEELDQTRTLTARMQSRIITIRNAAGTINDFEIRNALQVNADAWQDLLDSLKHRLERLQIIIDRCDARTKIESAKPKKPE